MHLLHLDQPVSKNTTHLDSGQVTINVFGYHSPGGGVALLYATKVLKSFQTPNNDVRRGVEMVENALKDDLHFGFDTAQGKQVDMVKTGIINPQKVVRTALLDASRFSGKRGLGERKV
nr:chaperonin CPN60-like 2, mitochondrial [Tanacetum cinerariifolium]